MGIASWNALAIIPPVSESRLALQARETLDTPVYKCTILLSKKLHFEVEFLVNPVIPL